MNNVVVTGDQVREIFQEAEHQTDYALALYRLAFPRWDEIEEIKGWPKVSKKFSLFIFGLAMEFDRKHHPKVFNGGLWMNKGFGSSEGDEIPWGTIDLSTCEVTYKQ
jgi:hypothetical protein